MFEWQLNWKSLKTPVEEFSSQRACWRRARPPGSCLRWWWSGRGSGRPACCTAWSERRHRTPPAGRGSRWGRGSRCGRTPLLTPSSMLHHHHNQSCSHSDTSTGEYASLAPIHPELSELREHHDSFTAAMLEKLNTVILMYSNNYKWSHSDNRLL